MKKNIKFIARADEKGLIVKFNKHAFDNINFNKLSKSCGIKLVKPLLSKKGTMNSNGGN